MYYLESGIGKHNRLRNAVVAALAAHAALILGISFDLSGGQSYSAQIEVALAIRPDSSAPDDARHIAQANQQGSGNLAEDSAVTSDRLPLPAAGMAPRQAQTAPRDMPLSADAVTARSATRSVGKDQDHKQLQQQVLAAGISPEVDRLSRELAALEAELDDQTRNYAETPRVRRLTSVATRQSADAAYLHSWLRRLEAVGNRYYPEASVRYGIYGSLRLLAVVRHDGTLEDVRVLSTSGYAVLDEAAIKTVRMAAPFAPFPSELRATTDKLEIIRTWHFEQNSLSSN